MNVLNGMKRENGISTRLKWAKRMSGLKSGTYNKWSNMSLRMNKLFVLNQERPVRLM